jgi:hypothetical protein
MASDPTLTDLDYFCLGVFATLHGGHLPDVPHGALETYRRLRDAKPSLVSLDEDTMQCGPEFDDDHLDIGDRPGPSRLTYGQCWIAATITPEGRAVVGVMLAAGRATAAGIVLDIPDANAFRRLCQPKNAIDGNTG